MKGTGHGTRSQLLKKTGIGILLAFFITQSRHRHVAPCPQRLLTTVPRRKGDKQLCRAFVAANCKSAARQNTYI